MIVAVSDVHLGYEKCNRESFEDFIDNFLAKEDIEHLVLLGDILDFWRRFKEGVLFENLQILYKLSTLNSTKTKKYYIIGNHDYCLCYLEDKPLSFTFSEELQLQSGDKKFKFIHGHQIEFGDFLPFYEYICYILCGCGDEVGHVLSDSWSSYRKVKSRFSGKGLKCKGLELGNLDKREFKEILEFISKYPEDRKMSPLYRKEFLTASELVARYKRRLGQDKDEILVYGHTHEPLNEVDRVNSGGWVDVGGSCKPNSYVTIDNGVVTLNYWK